MLVLMSLWCISMPKLNLTQLIQSKVALGEVGRMKGQTWEWIRGQGVRIIPTENSEG